MRWIWLLLLFSCAQDITPPYLDTGDFDGDQLLNYQEENLDRYLAKVTFPLVQGTVSFFSGEKSRNKISIAVSNRVDLRKLSMAMLAKTSKEFPLDYFDEERLLHLEMKQLPELDADHKFILDLNFTSNTITPDGIYLVGPQNSRQLTEWKAHQQIVLTREDLQSLLKKESFLAIAPMDQRLHDIKQKTYRVLMYDEHEGQIFYVSHKLGIKDFLDSLGVEGLNLQHEELFFHTGSSGPAQWLHRPLHDRLHVLMKTNLSEVALKYVSGLKRQQIKVARLNGKPQSPIVIKKDLEDRVFLKIRPRITTNEFTEKIHNEAVAEGRYSNVYCKNSYRVVARKIEANAHWSYFMTDLLIADTSLRQLLQHGANFTQYANSQEDAGYFLGISRQARQLELKLLPLTDGFINTGIIATPCPRFSRLSHVLTHPEAALMLEIEVYLEKLD
jgi:hypothetical protein